MKDTTNTPYKKVYDSDGIIINPITSENPFISFDSNRKTRREKLQKQRFYGESKNYHLSVFQNMKYLRFKQVIKDKLGKFIKVIEHYLPR